MAKRTKRLRTKCPCVPAAEAGVTPCAGCPSPILEGAPRMSELLIARNGVVYGVNEFHPGCWDVERRRALKRRPA